MQFSYLDLLNKIKKFEEEFRLFRLEHIQLKKENTELK